MTEIKLTATICREKQLTADIYRATKEGGIPYEGPYYVIPDFTGVTMNTKNKSLRDDISVEPIRVSIVTNPAGGKTVYIG